MKTYVYQIAIIVWKDTLLEMRTREVVISMIVFALLSVVTFNFAFDPTPSMANMVASGILWVTLVFAGILGLTRVFALEISSGGIDGTLLSPISRDAFFFGKVISTLIFMMFVEAILLPVMVVFFDLDFQLIPLILVSILALFGLALVGALFSAMAINTRAREVMLPVLYLPMIVPVLISAVECTEVILAGGGLVDISKWLSMMLVFDATYMVAAPFCFSAIASE